MNRPLGIHERQLMIDAGYLQSASGERRVHKMSEPSKEFKLCSKDISEKNALGSDKDDTAELTPISVDWLREVGFDNCRPCHVHGTLNCNWWNESLRLEIWQFNDTDQWLWVEYDSIPMRTRSDLRLLMEWMSLHAKP